MEVVSNEVSIRTGDEKMPAHLARPASGGPYPALVVVMEAFGLNDQIRRITNKFAAEGSRSRLLQIFTFASPTTSSATAICPAPFA